MSDKNKFPLWAKLLAGFVSLIIIAGTIALVALACYANYVAKQSTDPQHIATIAKSIADFPDKPPAGFTYQLGATIFGAKMLTILHKPDDTVLMIGCKPLSTEDSDLKAEKVVSDLADKGIPSVADELTIDKKGSEAVGGEEMAYIIGSSADKDGRAVSGLIGCIKVKKNNKMILIYGLSQAKSYNFEATKTMLSSIKGF
ncbi:MAG: hypothetical protein K2W82_08365 [Candidatus Obscuribacterales bacterium]|nr:hypothetical protein [Candidatus Obscuribacterales bacterium]